MGAVQEALKELQINTATQKNAHEAQYVKWTVNAARPYAMVRLAQVGFEATGAIAALAQQTQHVSCLDRVS